VQKVGILLCEWFAFMAWQVIRWVSCWIQGSNRTIWV